MKLIFWGGIQLKQPIQQQRKCALKSLNLLYIVILTRKYCLLQSEKCSHAILIIIIFVNTWQTTFTKIPELEITK